MRDSLIILVYYDYLHMIKFSEFDDLYDSHSAEIEERNVYTHIVIIIKKVHNDLFIHVRLGNDMGPWS